MFRKIVWATDGSELASRSLPFARDLAREPGAELLVLHVDQLLVGRAAGTSALADEGDVRRRISGQVDELKAEGIDARFVLVRESTIAVGSEIARVAEAEDADLVVIATHGRGLVGTLLHGSVAKKLLHGVPCPVLVVPVEHLAKVPEPPAACAV
ncbi:MAG TPA: universal stress protein [Gaiellaceae bacterium]|jgi:nucleotide-binding universal stress UspA family protein|nr:universal stress protein [Gaiellaceae bacterium]